MPIDRITRLREVGVFHDFTWPAALTDLGRYNLIYGWNGSGKTTLSRIFRDIELRRPPRRGEGIVHIDGADVRGEDFAEVTLQVRVFNRDFVNESVFPAGGADVPPIFVVGKESVEKQKEADRLKAEREEMQGNLNAARDTKHRAERDFDKHCTDRARTIKDALRLSGSAYNEYDKRDYQGRAQQMAADRDVDSHRLSDSQRDSVTAQHRATAKPKVAEVACGLPKLQALAEGVSMLLGTTVVSATIQALRDDAVLADWTRHGLGLHKDRKLDKCLFCEQPLPAGRLASLEAHFNAEYERLLRALEEQTQSLESARKKVSELRLPDRAALYDDLATEYAAAEQALQRALDAVQGCLGDFIKALSDKRAQPFKASALEGSIPEVDVGVVDQLNAVIRRHNQTCDDFEHRVSGARDRLAMDMIAESLDEFIRLRDAAQTAMAAIEPLQNEIERLAQHITRLERDIREHQQPAEELNEDLRRYLGHGDLQLTIKDTGYRITRNGVPADMLSEGEMTAIALLYFLKCLDDRRFDKRNGVVVLDDPVSSLDGNAMYLAFGLIRERTKDAGQLILMTHDFGLFRQARNWLHYLNRRAPRPSRFYMLDCVPVEGQRSASLRWLDPLLEQYESEYHYLFACVYGAWSAPPTTSLEDYYHVPNVARRLLEGFLAFKVPQASGDLYNALQLVQCEENKKTRILRFVHTQSHGADLVPGHDPTALGECRAVLSDLFDLMRALDDGHFSAMVQLANPQAGGGATA